MGRNRDDVAEQLQALETMGAPELRKLWKESFGRPHPGWVQREFLHQALAYHAQEKAYGGLGAALRRRLLTYADEVRLKGRIGSLARPKVKPGTRFLRSWGGEAHVVTAHEGEFEYRGKRYGSLSVIARTITGTRWSGPAFFGLKSGAGSEADVERD